jgi:hypothetical protein
MAEVNRKQGALTPDDLARYGIPPKQQPSNDLELKVSGRDGEKPGKSQSQAGRR